MQEEQFSTREKSLLAAIMDSATDYAIIMLDANNKITSWNIGAEKILGWNEDEILGRSGELIFIADDRKAGAPEQEMATALADGRAEDERWHARKDGSRFWASGLMMPLKNNLGFLKIMRDQTERRLAEQSLQDSEERFRTLAENIPQLVFRSRSMGERTWGSPQWFNFTGLQEVNSLGLGWLDAVHPADRDETIEAWAAAETSGELYVEHRVRRAIDGQYRWFQTRAKPLVKRDSRGTEWFGTSTDIDDLRKLKERQEVLVRELHHRTGNLLAVVSLIARRTGQSSNSLTAFLKCFEQRVQALSRVQMQIARDELPEIELGELLRIELDALGMLETERTVLSGPICVLSPRQAEALALAVHELATNALKYGALSNDNGKLVISWTCPKQGSWSLDWLETGVTFGAPEQVGRRGYGRELIDVALPYALGAQTRLEILPDQGVVSCRIEAPQSE